MPATALFKHLLRWLDRKRRIRFTDIAAPNFQATEFGITHADFMDEIHGRLPDENGNPGRWIIGVEVFRQLYAAVGFGPLVWPRVSLAFRMSSTSVTESLPNTASGSPVAARKILAGSAEFMQLSDDETESTIECLPSE